MFYKKGVFKELPIFTRKYLWWSLFKNLIKKRLQQVFSCEYSKMFKKTYFKSGTAIQKKHIIFFSIETPLKNKNLKNVIFDKLLKLGQMSYVIPYCIEIKSPLYQGKFFVNLLANWHKTRKIIA